MRSCKKFAVEFLPIMLALVSLLVAGCGEGGASNNSQQIYRIGTLSSDITTLDPAIAADIGSDNAIYPVFIGLVSLDDNQEVQPQLAASLPIISSDGLTYTFTLKPNLHFSDGTPLTAHDVAYSLDRALSPAVSSQNGVAMTYLGLIKGAADRAGSVIPTLIGSSLIVVDNNTLKIVISRKSAYFLQALTYPTSFVVEKRVIDKWGSSWINHLSDNGGQGGAGPWKVQSYDHTTGLTLVPNTQYYGKAQTLQVLKFVFYKSLDTMYADYQANQLDSTSVPSSAIAQAEGLGTELYRVPTLTTFYMTMNYLYKPFDNIDIRQAFSLAIDRDELAKNINNGQVTPTCHIIPNGMPGYNPNLKCPGGASTKGNKTLAQQLFAQGLAAEGLTKATFPSITLAYPRDFQGAQDQVTTAISMWSNVLGVTIHSRAEDNKQFLTDVNNTACQTPNNLAHCLNKGLAMWWLGWTADYPDPQDFTTLQFGAGAPNNAWNYGQNLSAAATNQRAAQAELAGADADLGPDRLSLYNDAEQKLVNDVVWLSLYQPESITLIKPYVYGVVPNALGTTPADDWAYIYISAH